MTTSSNKKLNVSFNGVADGTVKPSPAIKLKLRPRTFRATDEEHAEIKALAGSQSVSEYVREQALGRRSRRKRRKKVVMPTQENAARILALLGQVGVFDSLSRIANAAESGALPVSEELTDELRNACALIIAIRHDLIDALGVKVRD